ncbi:MAG: hypothetical protein ACOC8E_06750 [Planctomycetota bacterium]
MKISRLAIAAMVVLAVVSMAPARAHGCSVSNFELAEQQDLPPYSFVLFSKPGDDPNDQSLATLKDKTPYRRLLGVPGLGEVSRFKSARHCSSSLPIRSGDRP